MKTKHNNIFRFQFASVLLVALLASSCEPSKFLASTKTPTLTSTPLATLTSTATFTPTISPTPTLTAGQILDEAVALACQGKFTVSPVGGSSTDQPGARLCPDVDKIMLPQEWTANTLGSLRYIIAIETGSTPRQSCTYEGGITVRLHQSFQKIIVHDSMTGAVLKQINVGGADSYCPSVLNIGGSNDLAGDYAPMDVVEDEMIDLLRSLLPRLEVEPATLVSHADLTGTVWNQKDSFGDQYILEFLAKGILNISYSDGTYYSDSIWEQNGNSVSFSINNNFVIYEAVIRRNFMRGAARNKNGFNWTWTAELQ